jgi:hypothetical protein
MTVRSATAVHGPTRVGNKAAPSPVRRVRDIPKKIQLQLFVRAGGRCQFPGCAEYLLEHRHTKKAGNFAQMAHIVAFGRSGPRAKASLPQKYINDTANLMLMCATCHKEIDSRPDDWPVERLRQVKSDNEARIEHLTGLQDSLKTHILIFKSKIAGRVPDVRFEQVYAAVRPRYPADTRGTVIDLTQSCLSGEDLVLEATREIRAKVKALYAEGMDGKPIGHLSVLGIATIPLLTVLGRELSDKVETDFFQLHRDTQNWVWKTDGPDATFTFQRRRSGTQSDRVALVLSLSGTVSDESLPADIDSSYTVYEISLAEGNPNPTFLRKKADLARFRILYCGALRSINKDHPDMTKLHVFPAVPAPVALVCGNALLPKADPALLIYDKFPDGFHYAATVNEP